MAEKKIKSSRTSTLFKKLFESSDIEDFIRDNSQELSLSPFHLYISDLCKQRGLIPEQIIRHAAIERSYGHQLFNGTRKPSRDKVLQLAFGFKLTLDETQQLLQIAQKSILYPRIKRDAAIIFCINNRQDILEAQAVLQSLDLTLLGDA